jgi:hypothetical protein
MATRSNSSACLRLVISGGGTTGCQKGCCLQPLRINHTLHMDAAAAAAAAAAADCGSGSSAGVAAAVWFVPNSSCACAVCLNGAMQDRAFAGGVPDSWKWFRLAGRNNLWYRLCTWPASWRQPCLPGKGQNRTNSIRDQAPPAHCQFMPTLVNCAASSAIGDKMHPMQRPLLSSCASVLAVHVDEGGCLWI